MVGVADGLLGVKVGPAVVGASVAGLAVLGAPVVGMVDRLQGVLLLEWPMGFLESQCGHP